LSSFTSIISYLANSAQKCAETQLVSAFYPV